MTKNGGGVYKNIEKMHREMNKIDERSIRKHYRKLTKELYKQKWYELVYVMYKRMVTNIVKRGLVVRLLKRKNNMNKKHVAKTLHVM